MKKEELEPKNRAACGHGEATCSLPVLRFSIAFDLDISYVLSMFVKNTTQAVPVKLKCSVEKLYK